MLIELNNLSNEIYNKVIKDLRQFFKLKSIEEPKRYNETYRKIINVENEINKSKELGTILDKQYSLDSLVIKVSNILKKNNIKFVSKTTRINYFLVFNSLVENDLNILLYV